METPDQINTDEESRARKHEVSDANAGRVVVTGLTFLGIMVIGMILSWGVYSLSKSRSEDPEGPASIFEDIGALQPPPRPWLQANPADSLIKIRAMEDSILASYGWVDREKSIVRIPIERAMEIVAKEELSKSDSVSKVTK